jgi:hypothetical protein
MEELRTTWTTVRTATFKLEHIGGPAIQTPDSLGPSILFPRAALRALGRGAPSHCSKASEEILAKHALLLHELREYFHAF